MKSSQMNLTDYFEFLDQDDIRIRGTRVGLETVVNDYLNAFSPEEIAIRYPTLTLEQVYAVITYYLRNKNDVDNYMERWEKYSEDSWKKQSGNPAIKRLLELKKQRNSKAGGFLHEEAMLSC